MGGSPGDERLEEFRKKKMQEFQERRGGGGQGSAKQQRTEGTQQRVGQQKQAPLKQHPTDEARQCLNAVQTSKPDFVEQAERQIIALAQSGCIQGRIDDDKMKVLPKELQPESKSFNIHRR